MMAQQPAGAMRQRETAQRDYETARGRRNERRRNNQPTRREDERRRGAQREDEERQCDNKLARQVDERVMQ